MTVFDRIVCGIDGSAEGLEPLRQSKRLLAPDGRILAIVVIDASAAVQAGWPASEISAQLRREAEYARDEAARELDGVAGEARAVDGSPPGLLLAALREEQATLAAVGSHGGSRAAGILLGGVPTTLLHEAPCSVLVARAPADAESFPRSIVCGVDGSAEGLAAAEAAEILARRFRSSLRFLAATGGKPVDVDGLVRLEARHPVLVGAGATARVAALEWSERSPVDALVDASAGADLLVVGSRGLDGLAALGSVSERVAHRAACSVLVVRDDE